MSAQVPAKRNKVRAKPNYPDNPPVSDAQFIAIIADLAAGEPGYKCIPAHGVSSRSFWGALNADPEREKQYAHAKTAGLERLAEEIAEYSDVCRIGQKTTTKADGSVETVTADMVDRARLQVDSRKWLLSKLLPKRYGDKVTQEHTGPDGAPLGFIALPTKAVE